MLSIQSSQFVHTERVREEKTFFPTVKLLANSRDWGSYKPKFTICQNRNWNTKLLAIRSLNKRVVLFPGLDPKFIALSWPGMSGAGPVRGMTNQLKRQNAKITPAGNENKTPTRTSRRRPLLSLPHPFLRFRFLL